MEFCAITFCVLLFTLKLAASSPFYGDELGRPSGDYQTLGASHNGYVPEEMPLGLTRSQNIKFRSNNAYREPMNQEHYDFSRNGYENNYRQQVDSLLSSKQANNEFSTLPTNLNSNRYPHSSLGEESSFLNNPSEPRFRSEPFERGNRNFNYQPSDLHLSGIPVHNENIRNLESFRDLQNERIRNLEPMHTEPYYNPRQNMYNINSYQNGAQIKNSNIPSNEHIQNVPEPPWNNGPLPNRGINKIHNLHQLFGGIHPGYNVQQLISNPQIKEALQNIGTNSKKRYLIIHADGSIEHTDTLEPTIATNPNSLFLNKEQIIPNGNPPAVVTTNPEISSSPTPIDRFGSSLTDKPLKDLELNKKGNEDGAFDAKELLDEEIRASETSEKPLKTDKSLSHHFIHKISTNKHNFSSTLKPSPSDDDEEYEESATKAALLTSSIAEYTDDEDDDETNSLKTSDPKKNPGSTASFINLFNTEYSVDVKSKISTNTTKSPPISTTTSEHNHTHTITPPLTHKIAKHLHHHTTAHTLKTSTTKSPSLKTNDSTDDDKFRKPLKHSSTKTSITKTPKMHKTSSSKSWTTEENEDDELKTSKSTKKPTTPKTTIARKSHKLKHSTTKKYPLRQTPTTTENSSEIDYEDEYEYYLTEKPSTKSHPSKNLKRFKSTIPTSTKRPSKTTTTSKIMSPKHYSSESDENDEESVKKNKKIKYDNEDENKNIHYESYLPIKKNKKSKYDSEYENDNIGKQQNKSNSSINVKRKNMARNKSKTNKKVGKDYEEDFGNYDDKKGSFNKNGMCCQQITKHVIQNLYKEHGDPASLLIYHLNNVTVVERDTIRTLYPNGTVIEEISNYLVDNNGDRIKIRTKINIIHPDEYEEEEESDWY